MNDRDLSRIEAEHKRAKGMLINPLCPRCGERITPSTVRRGCDILDRWGGVCWGKQVDVPVWKCPNGHLIHIVMMG